MLVTILEKIKQKDASVCVLGLGRVGLPLTSVFATKGLQVFGIDNNEKRVNSIRQSMSLL